MNSWKPLGRLCTVLWALIASAHLCATPLPGEPELISLHKPYFLLPSPSYWGCSNAQDAVELTDGQRSRGDWLDPACVGWSEGGRDVAVLIDLGTSQPFDQVVISSMRGRFANVLPPLHAAVYASDDGQRFARVAELPYSAAAESDPSQRELEPGNVVTHLHLRIGGFAASGRYVLLTMKRGDFLILDEVSILRSAAAPETAPPAQSAVTLSHEQILSQYLGVPVVFNPRIAAFQTPHWPIAKPLAGGPIDLLAIIPAATSRDVEELAQRLDLALRVIATDEGPKSPMNGLLQVRIADELRRQPPRVLLLAGTRWPQLSAELRGQVANLIDGGMGLVLVDPQMKLEALRDAGLALSASTDALAGDLRARDNVIAMKIGSGRVALLDDGGRSNLAWHTLIPPPTMPLGELAGTPSLIHEYAYSRVAQAVRWSAGRDDQRRLAQVRHDGAISVQTHQADAADRLRLTAYDAYGEPASRRDAAASADSAITFDLPPSARHALLQLCNEQGQVLDWRLLSVAQKPPAELLSLQAPRSIAGPADQLALRLRFSNPQPQPDDHVQVTLTDLFGRVVGRQDVSLSSADGDELSLTLQHVAVLSRTAALRVVLRRGEVTLSELRQHLLVRQPPRRVDHFRLDFWSGSNEMAMRHYVHGIYQQAQNLGGNGIFATWPMDQLSNLAALHNLSTIPENIARIAESAESTATQRVPTLGSDADVQELQARMQATIEKFAPYGVELGSLGDECRYASTPDSDRSPLALQQFQAWLASRFDSLDALNRAMGTQLTAFEQAAPPLTAEVRSSKTFPLWLAHREFAVHQFNDAVARACALWRQHHPDVPFGISGAQLPSVSNGHDYATLAAQCDALSVYRGLQRELLRSFAKPGHHHALWSGFDYSTGNQRLEQHQVWLAALEGFRGIALFHQFEQTAHPMYSSGYVGPDLRPHQRALWMAQALSAVRQAGISQLIAESRTLDRDIAVVYSTRSLFLHHVCGIASPDYTDQSTLYLDAVGGMVHALQDLQRPFHLLDDSQLGSLDASQTRVVMLPGTISLSDAALGQLRRYAESGGHVMFDVNLGRFDEYGKPRLAEQVESLLGQRPAFVDALAPTPIFALKQAKLGRGSAIVLGGSWFDYQPTTVGGVGGELVESGGHPARQALLRSALDQALQSAGLTRAVRVESAPGTLAQHIEVFPFEGPQGYRFLGVLGNYREAGLMVESARQALTVTFGRSAELYELVEGVALGRADQVGARLEQGEARFFALLPQAVAAVQGSAQVAGGKMTVQGQVQLAGAAAVGPHVLRLEVRDAAGRDRPEYGAALSTRAGQASHVQELAPSDPPGIWQVTIIDTISRKQAQLSVGIDAGR